MAEGTLALLAAPHREQNACSLPLSCSCKLHASGKMPKCQGAQSQVPVRFLIKWMGSWSSHQISVLLLNSAVVRPLLFTLSIISYLYQLTNLIIYLLIYKVCVNVYILDFFGTPPSYSWGNTLEELHYFIGCNLQSHPSSQSPFQNISNKWQPAL